MSGTSDYSRTPNYALYKPVYDADEDQWGTHWNVNADILDTTLNNLSVNQAGGPFLPTAGGTMLGPLNATAPVTVQNPAAPANQVFLQPPSGPGETTANGSQLHTYLAFQPSTPGTYGDVFSNIRADANVTGSPLISLWGVTSVIDSSVTGGNAGFVSFYGQCTRVTQNSGGTGNNPELWGATLEVRDVTNTDSALTNSLNGLEIDMSVGNTDSANNRRAIGIYLNPANGTDVVPTCDLGIHVAANQGSFNSMLRCYGTYNIAAVDLKGAVPASGAHAIWLRDGGQIAWNTSGSVLAYYDPTVFGSGGVHFNSPSQWDGAMHLVSGLQVDGGVGGAGFTSLLAPYALSSSVPVASSAAPVMDGTAAAGSGTTWSRTDHVHPSDTSRAPLASPTFSGTVNLGSGTVTGTALSNYFASPPAIGGTAAAAGTFVNLRANGWIFAAYNAAPAFMPSAGSYGALGWNASNGQGEVSYINSFATPGFSHIFWQQTGPAAATRLMDIGTTGNVTAYAGFTVNSGGPTIRAGAGAPSGAQPNGSLWLRTDGTAAARLYVSNGSTWAAVAGV